MSVTLGTDWKKVCQASTQISSNITGYVRLYMKYGNRSGLNDTIYWEIRQFAYNQYGTYNAWQWLTPIAYSIKSGNTTKASGTIDQSAWIKSYSSDKTSNEVVKASGSYVQAHNSDGTFSATITLSAPIYNSTYTATGDIVLPTIIVNPSLSVSYSGTFTTSGVLVTSTLSNTGGASTQIQYSTDSTPWADWFSVTGDSVNSRTLPSYLLGNFSTTYTAKVYFRAKNTNGTSTTQTLNIPISTDIKPSISASNITLTPINDSYSQISGLFVQGLSGVKVEAQGTAYANGGASINRYDLTALGGYNSNVTKSNMTITNSKGTYQYTTKLQKSGSITAKVKVYDTRGGTAEATSNSVNVIPYSNPSISSFKVERCTSNGTLSDTGTYCKITVVYNIAPINNGSTNKNTKSLTYSINNTSGSITLSGYSGTATATVGGGNLATNGSYPVSVTLSDISKSVTQNATLPTSFVLVSKRNGGKGIAFGKIAESDNFECALSIIDRNGHKVNEFNGRNSNMDYTKTSSEYGTKRTDIVYSGSTSRPNTDGFTETYFWDNSGTYDTQVFFPNNGTATPKYRSKGGGSSWGNWQSLGKKELVCARLSSHTDITISSTYTNYKVALSNTSYIATNTYELTSDGGIKIKVAGTYLINANIVLYASVITDLISMITRKKASDSSTVQVFCGYTRGDVANTWHTLSFSEFPLTVEANDIIYLNVQTSNTCTVKVAGTNSRFTYMTIKDI